MPSPIIEVNNTFGSLLISDTHPSLSCREKGSIATNTDFTIYDCELPLMAFRCGNPVTVNESRSGNNITYSFSGNYGDTVYWYYHDRPVPVPDTPGEAVLQGFDVLGRCVVEGRGKIGRVVGTTFGTYSSGREYAAVMLNTTFGSNWIWNDPTGSVNDQYWQEEYYAAGVMINGNNIQYGTAWSQNGSSMPGNVSPPASYTAPAPPVIILDVTGY